MLHSQNHECNIRHDILVIPTSYHKHELELGSPFPQLSPFQLQQTVYVIHTRLRLHGESCLTEATTAPESQKQLILTER